LPRFKFRFLILFLIVFIISPPTILEIQSQNEDSDDSGSMYISTLGFYFIDEDSDLPAMHPISIKKDTKNNIHAWMYYIKAGQTAIQSDLVVVYHAVIKSNGEMEFHHLSQFAFTNSRFALFYNQELLEINGTISGIFIQPTDFGQRLLRFSWNENSGLHVENLSIPVGFLFNGHIIGPIINDGIIEYYLTRTSILNQQYSLLRLRFDGNEYLGQNSFNYPVVNYPLGDNGTVTDIFDVTYANSSRFLLTVVNNEITILEDHLNGTYTFFSSYSGLNPTPLVPGFPYLSMVLTDLIKPQLVSTNSGELYSYIFGLTGETSQLIRWVKNGYIDVFADAESDPFLITFLPIIKSIENEIRIAAFGFQYAQQVGSITADLFKYNTVTQNLQRSKFEDSSFSSAIFLFAFDLDSPNLLALLTTFSTPEFLKHRYRIANETVGSTFLISDSFSVEVEPFLVNVHRFEDEIELETFKIDFIQVLIIGSLVLFITLAIGFYLRNRYLKLPNLNKRLSKTAKNQFHLLLSLILMSLISLLYLHLLFLKTNWRRILTSISVLILPSLIMMSLFVGLISHEQHLMETFEASNRLNHDNRLTHEITDMVWQRSIFNDELSNITINNNEWDIPLQLTHQAMLRYNLDHLIGSMSSLTVFPLFDKRSTSYINNQGDNVTLIYPFPHNIAILDENWISFIEEKLLIDGRLPENKNEVLVQQDWFVERDELNSDQPWGNIFEIGNEIGLYGSEFDIFLNSTISGLSQNFTIVGMIRKIENHSFSQIQNMALELNTTVAGVRKLDAIPFFTKNQFASPILNEFTRVSLRPITLIDIHYNVFEIDRGEIPQILLNIDKINGEILSETGYAWFGNFTGDRLYQFLEGYYISSRNIQLQGTLLTIPVLILTLLLTYEALGIGQSSIRQEIIRYKREGLRSETIFSYYLTERVVTSGIAVFLGLIVVNPVTHQLLSFTGFFEIGNVFVPPVVSSSLIGIYFIVFLLLTSVGLFLSGKYIFSTDINSIFSENTRIKDFNGMKTDTIIILLSIFVIWISSYLIDLIEDQIQIDGQNQAIDPTTELILMSLRLIGLLLLFFSIMIIISKLINRIFMIIGHVGWKISQTYKGLIFNGIKSNISVYGKILLVMILCLFLIVPMTIIPNSIENKYLEEAYNEINTDIRIESWNRISMNQSNQVSQISEIQNISSYFYGSINFNSELSIHVLAIDPLTFINTIHIPERFFSEYEIDIESIESLSDYEIITTEDFKARNALQIGDQISILFDHVNQALNLTIVNSYQKFPVLKYEMKGMSDPEMGELQMVLTINTLKSIQSTLLFNSTSDTTRMANVLDERNAIVRLNTLDNIHETSDKIRDITGLNVETVYQLKDLKRHPFFRIFEFISHISVIVALVGPVLLTYTLSNILFQRRKYELEVYHRNGVSTYFFNLQLTIEFLLTTIIPSIIGIFLGFYWSFNYGGELFGEDSSQINWVIKTELLVLYSILIILSSIIIWFTQILHSSKQHLKEVRL
jgi:hypothetical protein